METKLDKRAELPATVVLLNLGRGVRFWRSRRSYVVRYDIPSPLVPSLTRRLRSLVDFESAA